MKEEIESLFQPLTLANGLHLSNRFVMAPMVVQGSLEDGTPSDEDFAYFDRRKNTASLLITGAANVAPYGNAFGYGLAIDDDSKIPAWKKLASTMKAGGAKAIVQIFHPGREAAVSYEKEGKVLAPSAVDFSFLDYPVTEMTDEDIWHFVEAFAQATRRAIEAGFDGVEIHGANHYLIQQFFSSLSNFRQDDWGGSIENRARFAVEVTRAVNKIVDELASDDFIVGYRISPEEIHGSQVGYDLEDMLYLVDQLLEEGLDYLHTSQWGPEAFANKSQSGHYQGQVINHVLKERLDQGTLLFGAGDITTPKKALQAESYLDGLGLASAAILEPDMLIKMQEGRDQDFSLLKKEEDYEDLALPVRFSTMAQTLRNNGTVPSETVSLLKRKPK